jgi:hypothetical protein
MTRYSHRHLLNPFKQLTADYTGSKNLFVIYGEKEDREDGGTGKEGIDNFNYLITLLSDTRYSNITLKSEVFPTYGHIETAIPKVKPALTE